MHQEQCYLACSFLAAIRVHYHSSCLNLSHLPAPTIARQHWTSNLVVQRHCVQEVIYPFMHQLFYEFGLKKKIQI